MPKTWEFSEIDRFANLEVSRLRMVNEPRGPVVPEIGHGSADNEPLVAGSPPVPGMLGTQPPQ
jgi:hypothetical protein